MSVVRFPSKKDGGDGPEDLMLEQRVARLEQILASLEPKITEILLTGAKTDDPQKAQVDLARIEGRISGIEGRIVGIDGRLSLIPTTWQIIAILASLLIGVSGIVLTA
jgi:hypothetical protein